jgi:undecaprenyl-diphosphatase
VRHRVAQQHPAAVAAWIGVFLAVAGVAGFLVVLDWVSEGEDLATVDDPVLQALAAARSPLMTTLLTAVTTVSGPVVLPVVVLVGCVVWAVRGRVWWEPTLLAGAVVAATAVSSTVKELVARPRPPDISQVVPGVETTYSFPSGHTIGAGTFLLVVGYLVWVRRPDVRSLVQWVLGVAGGVLLVAMSRVYLGYHFVTDVVASMALAVTVLGVVVVLDRRRAARAARATAATTG